MKENYVCCIPYLRRKHTSYDCDYWYKCVNWWHLKMPDCMFLSCHVCVSECIMLHTCFRVVVGLSPIAVISRCFFHFFKILIFPVGRGEKWQKMTRSDKKFCLSYSISEELYLRELLFIIIQGRNDARNLLQSVGEIKNESLFVGGRKSKNVQ